MSNALRRTAARFTRILFVALLAAPAMTQQAQPTRYSVEIVVFRTERRRTLGCRRGHSGVIGRRTAGHALDQSQAR